MIFRETADEGTAVALLNHRSKGQSKKDPAGQDPKKESNFNEKLERPQLWPDDLHP
jgi:hypothetical protein